MNTFPISVRINMLLARKNLLLHRDRDNGNIIRKIDRRVRNLRKQLENV